MSDANHTKPAVGETFVNPRGRRYEVTGHMLDPQKVIVKDQHDGYFDIAHWALMTEENGWRRETRKAAVALIQRQDGRVLCVWNLRYNGFSLPGGMVENGETTEDALRRELREETSCEVATAALIFEGEHNLRPKTGERGGRASVVALYRVTMTGEPRETEPGCRIEWLTWDDFLAQSPFGPFYRAILPNAPRPSDAKAKAEVDTDVPIGLPLLRGRRVRIRAGIHKGREGFIRDATADEGWEAKVELDGDHAGSWWSSSYLDLLKPAPIEQRTNEPRANHGCGCTWIEKPQRISVAETLEPCALHSEWARNFGSRVDKAPIERWSTVASFASVMRSKLDENAHKGNWTEDAPHHLLARVCEEVAEVVEALNPDSEAAVDFLMATRDMQRAAETLSKYGSSLKCHGDPTEVVNEAADVANMVMMVADVMGGLEKPNPSGKAKT